MSSDTLCFGHLLLECFRGTFVPVICGISMHTAVSLAQVIKVRHEAPLVQLITVFVTICSWKTFQPLSILLLERWSVLGSLLFNNTM